jgi:hypothetical protein
LGGDSEDLEVAMYSVGQKLWYVPTKRRGDPREVEITKVGRKWLSLDNDRRVAVDGLYADGGQYSSPGRAYISKEAWERETSLRKAWDMLSMEIDRTRRVPADVSVETIHQVRQLLGFKD